MVWSGAMSKRARTAVVARRTERKRPAPATASLAATFTPQLATLVKAPPEGDAWLHEQKLDGYRIGCSVDGGKVRLISRAGHDWTDKFPTIRDAARRLRVQQVLLDGEAAAVLPSGLTSFQALQNSFRGDATANRETTDCSNSAGTESTRESVTPA